MKFTTFKDIHDWIENNTAISGDGVLAFLSHIDADMFLGDGNDPHPTVPTLAGMLMHYACISDIEVFTAEWLTTWYSDIDVDDPDDSEEGRTDHLIFMLDDFFGVDEQVTTETVH